MSPIIATVSLLSLFCAINSACVHDKDCDFKEVCEFGMCFPSVNLTEECSFTSQCKVEDENAICRENSCQCEVGVTTMGSPCRSSLDEIDEVTDEPVMVTITPRSRDTPPSPRYVHPSIPTTTIKLECFYDSQCKPGFFCSSDYECLQLVQVYGPCHIDQQCRRVTSFSECHNGHCECYTGMYFNGTVCVYEVTTYHRRGMNFVVLLTPLFASISLVAIGLIIFYFVRRHRRSMATRSFQEKTDPVSEAVPDEAAPLPSKPVLIETSPFDPDLYPKL